MWDMDLNGFSVVVALVVTLLTAIGCTPQPPAETPRTLQLQQSWELQPGDFVAGHSVTGGLGDIAIALQGNAVYAPLDGRLQPHNSACVIFSSAELPIYLFRLCGLKNPKFGQRHTGEKLGVSDTLNLALLNRRPDAKWAFVEPSQQILERMLQSSR